MSDEREKEIEIVSEAAKTMSAVGSSLGGEARALVLSKEERVSIARKAAQARWGKHSPRETPLPKATHAGTLKIGEIEIPCAVLDNGMRVLTQRGVYGALGRSTRTGSLSKKDGAQQLPRFLAPDNLSPYISEELRRASTPIVFTPISSGNPAYGYPAELLPKICEVYLKARAANALQTQQRNLAIRAEILVRGLAIIGIVALVDEATGYQDARTKDALAKILEQFIAKELRPWVKTFQDDFYKEIFRLKNWPYREESFRKRPGVVGKYTNNIIYERLAPGVLAELRIVSERHENGRLKHKYFQRLTEETGHPKLKEHIAAVTALMRVSDSWEQFKKLLQRALPAYNTNLDLPFPEENEI